MTARDLPRGHVLGRRAFTTSETCGRPRSKVAPECANTFSSSSSPQVRGELFKIQAIFSPHLSSHSKIPLGPLTRGLIGANEENGDLLPVVCDHREVHETLLICLEVERCRVQRGGARFGAAPPGGWLRLHKGIGPAT